MSIARHHAEWLSLIEISGPFLSMPVLMEVFPTGLEAHDPDHQRLLRLAHEEWDAKPDDLTTHNSWSRFVLAKTLEYPPQVLLEGQAIPQSLQAEVAEHREFLRPNFVLKDPNSGQPRMLIQTYPRNQDLTKPVPNLPWKASPDTRMTELLHVTGVRLGLVTNGERWMLVDAPKGETSGYASWYASLWLDEPITVRAFRTLLRLGRFVDDDKSTPEALLARSAANQQEVTDQLGYQVRKAVEVLIQSLDRADQDHGRELLGSVKETELYEAALTVMMRLVFLFCAEERELLLLGDDLYDQHFAVSTISEQLRATADQYGEEILERRHDAWCRLLTNFRTVYGGISHDNFKLPAYGGRLFDPDRFPFLEGRKSGTTWKDAEATPLPVNNRTVLHLLEALQMLQVKVPGGGPAEARRLSFRALDIEQIGHVYEGLLDHTAKRANEPYLGLVGTKNQEPEIPLAELEKLQAKGEKDLLTFLKDETGKSEPALKKALKVELDAQEISRFRTVCQGDESLWQRVKPLVGFVRRETFGYPVVIPKGSVFVTAGTDRRSSGTHYTPKSLTEPIVQYTLEPLVYVGPAEGKPKSEWQLKSARDLLDLKICDMACGSGAFLVQACRYMAERLLEAWDQAEKDAQVGKQDNLYEKRPANSTVVRITPYGQPSKAGLYEQLIPLDLNERKTFALRLVAQRCLYGVDKNPLAVEMAKLSLWLLTLAKDKPFEFLDHAIRCGDSLVGIHDLKQLENLTLSGEKQFAPVFLESLQSSIREAVKLRKQLMEHPGNDPEQVKAQEALFRQANDLTAKLRAAADLLMADVFNQEQNGVVIVAAKFRDSTAEELQREADKELGNRLTFHWPIEFPEVFQERGGFDAFVCNPPFMGGKKITGAFGDAYREYLVKRLASELRGNADLCAYFFLRAANLMRDGGQFGFLATNSIAQGDTREIGLNQIVANGCVIPRAVASRPWPGAATLEVAHVWVRRGQWTGSFFLDDSQVPGITSFLTTAAIASGMPQRINANQDVSFVGSYVLGMGFVLEPEDAQKLIEKDGRNKDVLFPYLNGEDLNSSPNQAPRRWVISFFDWPIEKAMEYPDCFRIIEQTVKPERTRKDNNGEYVLRKPLPQRWWHYADKRPALYQTIAGLGRVLVRAQVSRTWAWEFVPLGWVYDAKVIVFAFDGFAHMSLLQSTIHWEWSILYGTTLRTDMSYTPTRNFETFPFPGLLSDTNPMLERVGKGYHEHRREIMLAQEEGLTKTYNRFHAPDETSADIQKLRQLHVEMDQTVAAAYGWTDLDLGHGFHQTKQGLRYTISEPARREVLARLLKLNHERYAEEVAKGLHEKKKRNSRRRTQITQSDESGLFG